MTQTLMKYGQDQDNDAYAVVCTQLQHTVTFKKENQTKQKSVSNLIYFC